MTGWIYIARIGCILKAASPFGNPLSVNQGFSFNCLNFCGGMSGSNHRSGSLGTPVSTEATSLKASSQNLKSPSRKALAEDAASSHASSSKNDKNPKAASQNAPFTHFVSLPLAIHPELKTELENFKKTILGSIGSSVEKGNTFSDTRIDGSIFINPRTFHLTVLMLKLESRDKVEQAVEVLKSAYVEVMNAIGNEPIFVRLNGLACMRGSIEKARVVYAKVAEDRERDRLLQACDVIITAFRHSGLVSENETIEKLKLHATVMNVVSRRGKLKQRNDFFDAGVAFEKYGTKEWGKYLIREAHLSQRFVYDENGYYHCCASLLLPAAKRERK